MLMNFQDQEEFTHFRSTFSFPFSPFQHSTLGGFCSEVKIPRIFFSFFCLITLNFISRRATGENPYKRTQTSRSLYLYGPSMYKGVEVWELISWQRHSPLCLVLGGKSDFCLRKHSLFLQCRKERFPLHTWRKIVQFFHLPTHKSTDPNCRRVASMELIMETFPQHWGILALHKHVLSFMSLNKSENFLFFSFPFLQETRKFFNT